MADWIVVTEGWPINRLKDDLTVGKVKTSPAVLPSGAEPQIKRALSAAKALAQGVEGTVSVTARGDIHSDAIEVIVARVGDLGPGLVVTEGDNAGEKQVPWEPLPDAEIGREVLVTTEEELSGTSHVRDGEAKAAGEQDYREPGRNGPDPAGEVDEGTTSSVPVPDAKPLDGAAKPDAKDAL